MYEQALTIHRLFHRMAQRNRAIGNALPGGLSLVQDQLLVELDAKPTRTLRDLERLLKLDQSSISRIASGLEREGFLKRLPDPEDGRRYHLQLTPKADRIVTATDRGANQRLEELCADLTAHEIRDLKRYFQLLADGLGEAPGIARPGEHSLRVEQRRLARAVGLLSDSYMQSGLAASYWHLLSEVCTSRDTPHVKHLGERLGLAKTSVSTLLNALQRKGLIRRVVNKSDARSVFILPTEKGAELFTRLESEAAERIQSALSAFPRGEAERFCELLRRFVLSGDRSLTEVLARGSFRRADTQTARAQARSFLVTQGIRGAAALHLPETLFGGEHVNVVFDVEGSLQAAFQFERKLGRLSLLCAGWIKELEPHLSELALKAAQFVGSDSFEIAFPPLAALADRLHLPRPLALNSP